MATNFPGPYVLKNFYSVGGREHVQQLNVQVQGTPDPGDGMDTITFLTKDGGSVAADVAIDAWIELMKTVLSTMDSSSWTRAELWKAQAGTFNLDFISTYTTGVAGTVATAVVIASEIIWTFRTANGGSMRVHVLDTPYSYGDKDTPPFAYQNLTDVADFVVSDDAWMYARDNSYAVSPVAFFPGQNEALFKELSGR